MHRIDEIEGRKNFGDGRGRPGVDKKSNIVTMKHVTCYLCKNNFALKAFYIDWGRVEEGREMNFGSLYQYMKGKLVH